ncbi:MAG TPA: hypothetical protein VGI85_10660 [Chthoniobacterales bacterium]
MNWKKLLFVVAAVGAFAFVSAPKSEAGVHIGIGIGFPIVYPAYGYPYAGYYPYAYNYGAYPYYGSYGYYSYGGPIFYHRHYLYRRPVVVYRGRVAHHHHHR